MSDHLPQKYKNNIFQNIIQKIRAVFFYKEQNITQTIDTIEKNTEQIMNVTETKQNKKENMSNFTEQIKVENENKHIDYEKKKFMQSLIENPELLKEFSNDRLEKILQYYLEENEQKREILKRMST